MWKWSWPNLRYYPGICLEGLSKMMRNISQDSRSPERDLNSGSPEYEARVLTTLRRRSVRVTDSDKVISLPGRDLKPGPPEYEAGVLTTLRRRSVSVTDSDKVISLPGRDLKPGSPEYEAGVLTTLTRPDQVIISGCENK
jgi:hypothetical protein